MSLGGSRFYPSCASACFGPLPSAAGDITYTRTTVKLTRVIPPNWTESYAKAQGHVDQLMLAGTTTIAAGSGLLMGSLRPVDQLPNDTRGEREAGK